jgi:hypothetical protein
MIKRSDSSSIAEEKIGSSPLALSAISAFTTLSSPDMAAKEMQPTVTVLGILKSSPHFSRL